MKINWKWPAKKGNHLAPGYVILWRTIWLLPLFTSLACFCFFVLISYGIQTAKGVFLEHL